MSPWWIDWPGPGRLAVCPRPRGGDWLVDDLRSLARASVDVLVSALTSVEERDLDLLQEERLAAEAGLRFVRLRTDDLAVPDFDTASAVIDELAAEVRVGRGVAVHCRMGVGRSPLIAAGLLVALGCQPDEAWQRVERARAVRVPDTEAQREWIATYARWRGAGHL